MITMTVDSKQLIEESKQKGFLPSPPMTEAEDRVMPQQDEVEAPGQEGLVGEVILPGPGYETGQVILVVPAFTDPSLVFRFCYKLREIEGVEIASFNYSSKGTIIKLALLNPLPVLETLHEIAEVEGASRGVSPKDSYDGELPAFLSHNSQSVILVDLRAA